MQGLTAAGSWSNPPVFCLPIAGLRVCTTKAGLHCWLSAPRAGPVWHLVPGVQPWLQRLPKQVLRPNLELRRDTEVGAGLPSPSLRELLRASLLSSSLLKAFQGIYTHRLAPSFLAVSYIQSLPFSLTPSLPLSCPPSLHFPFPPFFLLQFMPALSSFCSPG